MASAEEAAQEADAFAAELRKRAETAGPGAQAIIEAMVEAVEWLAKRQRALK